MGSATVLRLLKERHQPDGLIRSRAGHRRAIGRLEKQENSGRVAAEVRHLGHARVLPHDQLKRWNSVTEIKVITNESFTRQVSRKRLVGLPLWAWTFLN